MFKTSRNSEVIGGFSAAGSNVQFWRLVEFELTWPWFYLQRVDSRGGQALRTMLMITNLSTLEQIAAEQTEEVWLEQAYLVTPEHVSGRGHWMMEPLLRVRSLVGLDGQEVGFDCTVVGGHTYAISGDQAHQEANSRVVFDAPTHIRG